MKPVCVIPARGGSKRLPRKNVALLGGKPLLAWSVDAALSSGVFERVVVSSEDGEILACARESGAETLPRDPSLAGDDVEATEVLLDAVEQLEVERFAYLMIPTSPFRRPETIRLAWETFLASGAETLISVVPFEHPPQWALGVEDGHVFALDPERFDTPRSRLAKAWRHDGGHVVLDVPAFLRRRTLIGPSTVAFAVDAAEALDVDEPEDLAWAEFLLQRSAA